MDTKALHQFWQTHKLLTTALLNVLEAQSSCSLNAKKWTFNWDVENPKLTENNCRRLRTQALVPKWTMSNRWYFLKCWSKTLLIEICKNCIIQLNKISWNIYEVLSILGPKLILCSLVHKAQQWQTGTRWEITAERQQTTWVGCTSIPGSLNSSSPKSCLWLWLVTCNLS